MPLDTLDLGVTKWLLCVALGAGLAVDATSWLQVMVSRPIVGGTLGGALFGNAEAGFLAGALLELLFLRYPPFGGARYPDPGPSGFIAGAANAAAGGEALAALSAAVAVGWIVGWLGARSVRVVRALNGRRVGDPGRLTATPRRLARRHRAGIALEAARGGLLSAAFLVPGIFAVRLAGGTDSIGPSWLPVVLLLAAVLGSAAIGLRNLGAGRRWWSLLLPGPIVLLLLTLP
ncbi:MAG: PTS sugar transporter subunit IIC [Gemmatimonadota bacterium]